jgi:amidase
MTSLTRRALAAAPLAMAAAAANAAPKPQPAPPSAWPDATETAAMIRRGQVSALEVVQTAIAQAERLQPVLNFMVNSDFDRALAKARVGAGSGPFAGVPFLIKDLDPYIGLPTRQGSESGLGSPPVTAQTPYIDAFDRTGVVVIGKSATPEYGFLPTTEPVAFGPTRNPWDLTRSSGGSSGGSSVAVAAGIVPFAHANDGGGSIRIPASNCGLFGLKPSRGRMIGTQGERQITDLGVDHVVTRSVRDSAAMFAATEDTSPGRQLEPVGFVAGPSKSRLRLGLVTVGSSGKPPTPEVLAATEDTAKLLESLGHHVEPAQWPMGPEFTRDFLLVWAAGAGQLADSIAKAVGHPADLSLLDPFSLGMAQMAAKAPAGALAAATQRLYVDVMAYDPWLVGHRFDAIISPVLASPPPLLGYVGPEVPFDTLVARLTEYVGYTPYHNVVGAPAMSVPLHWTDAGLPVGTQIFARVGAEGLLFDLAYQLEAARPWAGRIPPTHA